MMIRLYRWLLFLYPANYWATFGTEMTKVFAEAHAAAQKRAAWDRAAFCLRELTGLVRAASHAQIRIHRRWADRMRRLANGRAIVTPLIFVFVAVVAAIEILRSFVFHGHRAQPMLWHEFLLAVMAELTVACCRLRQTDCAVNG
jgi:hypothetical protein